jgi:chaperone modulatory protein CbpM
MINEREFLERAHLDRTTLEVWIREEWICPVRTAPEPTFTEMDLARANLIYDLKQNMGVNDAGLDVILHLLDQMHGLRKALAEALSQLREREAD